jgi:hypothetical protein
LLLLLLMLGTSHGLLATCLKPLTVAATLGTPLLRRLLLLLLLLLLRRDQSAVHAGQAPRLQGFAPGPGRKGTAHSAGTGLATRRRGEPPQVDG